MVFLFDVNGFIAGMQSPVPLEYTYNNQYFDYEGSTAYLKSTVAGVEVNKIMFILYSILIFNCNDLIQAYVTTVYFVDPSIICSTGRTQEQFDVDGTGTDILFQNGPSFAPENLIRAPYTEDEIVAEVCSFLSYYFMNAWKCNALVPILGRLY